MLQRKASFLQTMAIHTKKHQTIWIKFTIKQRYRIEKDCKPRGCEKRPITDFASSRGDWIHPTQSQTRNVNMSLSVTSLCKPSSFQSQQFIIFYYSTFLRTIRRSNVSPEISLLVKMPASYTSRISSKSYENTIIEGVTHRINLHWLLKTTLLLIVNISTTCRTSV